MGVLAREVLRRQRTKTGHTRPPAIARNTAGVCRPFVVTLTGDPSSLVATLDEGGRIGACTSAVHPYWKPA